MKLRNADKIRSLIAVVTGCFFIFGCENSFKEINDVTSPKHLGIEQAKGVTINYSIVGKTKARITAPLMLLHQDTTPYIEFPKTIHADFYDDSLVIESRLDALYARYMEAESKVFLRDSVRVINSTGDTLYCKELYWDRARTGREFYTDDSVRIRTRTHVIDGTGLEAPQDFKQWNIRDPKGTVKIPASQFPG